MPVRVATWSPDISSVGPAAVAVGVFDGVHAGHQALLRDAAADGHARGIATIAVTFDRDPDQVVSPQTAAPQLLTLADKLRFIAQTGVDAILVVPFTHGLAEMTPDAFVEGVLLAAMSPVAVHVGRDFRFGSRAEGDVATLQRLGVTHGFEVVPHDLVAVKNAPVTSTRIRALVAAGEVGEAAVLLGRPTRVVGTIHHGRGEGAQLGYPTANMVPVPFAALPADGVYAGRAILEDGETWASAISVGTPPSFPEARDYLEAHLVQFEGDIYGRELTLEFFELLRPQQVFRSQEELSKAIAGDVAAALESAGFDDDDGDGHPIVAGAEILPDGSPLVEDPDALEAAESAVRRLDVGRTARRVPPAPEAWTTIASDMPYDKARLGAIDFALSAAGVPAEWWPFEPLEAPLLRLFGLHQTRFALRVPDEEAETARLIISEVDARADQESEV